MNLEQRRDVATDHLPWLDGLRSIVTLWMLFFPAQISTVSNTLTGCNPVML